MPSIIKERIAKLMAEQQAEAPLPTSRAVMDFGEQEVEEPEVQEAEPMEEPPLPTENTALSAETTAPVQEEQDRDYLSGLEVGSEPVEERPDPEWEDVIAEFDAEPQPELPDDPYGRAMADVDWRMALQQREQSLI